MVIKMKRLVLWLFFLIPMTASAAVELDVDGDGAVDIGRGGTGIILTDPGADRLWFWDESGDDISWLFVGNGLSISDTTIAIDESYAFTWTGEHTFTNVVNLPSAFVLSSDLTLAEAADHASTPTAGYGYLWVKNDTPAKLMYTDDSGSDFDLTAASAGDAVSIDGVGVTNPDFVSTGDIDFVDTSNTVTANINDSSVESRHLESITLSPIILAEPDQLQGISDTWPLYQFLAETYPSGVTITSIHVSSSSTCSDTLNFEEWSNNGASWSIDDTVDALVLSGTHTEDAGIDSANVAADAWLYVDLDDSPTDINYLSITISFTSQ